MDISSFIKELLLLNDCVIIPEFGGFIANYKPASISNNKFSPPSKEIAFNNKLTSNDGLLINFISEKEGISYFEAKQQLETFVEESFLNLERNRNLNFDGIGYLHYDSHENLVFEPQITNNLLAESYGLQTFSFEKLYQRQLSNTTTKPDYKEPIPVIFQKRKIRKIAVAIPLLLALALIPMKNHKEYLSKSDLGMWTVLSSVNVSTPAVNETKIETVNEELIEASSIELKYFIIGGSFRSEENAEKYISQLKDMGYSGINLGVFKGLNRVAMVGFSSMEEAQNELNKLVQKNPGSGLWIHVKE